jgi:hypothetical protein
MNASPIPAGVRLCDSIPRGDVAVDWLLKIYCQSGEARGFKGQLVAIFQFLLILEVTSSESESQPLRHVRPHGS